MSSSHYYGRHVRRQSVIKFKNTETCESAIRLSSVAISERTSSCESTSNALRRMKQKLKYIQNCITRWQIVYN